MSGTSQPPGEGSEGAVRVHGNARCACGHSAGLHLRDDHTGPCASALHLPLRQDPPCSCAAFERHPGSRSRSAPPSGPPRPDPALQRRARQAELEAPPTTERQAALAAKTRQDLIDAVTSDLSWLGSPEVDDAAVTASLRRSWQALLPLLSQPPAPPTGKPEG